MKKMMAICVAQPFATDIINGDKCIEALKWGTNFRGEILICSSAEPMPAPGMEFVAEDPKNYPLGCVLGKVTLVDCVPMHPRMREAAYMNAGASVEEYFAWILDAPVKAERCYEPLSAVNEDGFFEADVPDELAMAKGAPSCCRCA